MSDFTHVKNKVEDIVDHYVQQKFLNRRYDTRDAQSWSNEASDEIIQRVEREVSSEYKYMCTVIILGKGDSGFHMSASCFWESKSDGNFNKKWEFEDFYLICNFFGVSRS